MLAVAVPPVSFFFPDRTRSVSEAGAAFLVAQLQGRPDVSETVANLAERIEIESRRGRFAPPGQDLELNREEQHSGAGRALPKECRQELVPPWGSPRTRTFSRLPYERHQALR